MAVLIAGLGTAVPPHRIAQPEAAEIARQYSCESPDHERVFNAVYWGTGVETRHSVVLESPKSNGDACPRQTFYGDQSPTTRERMEKYESKAGDLAVAAAHRALADAQLAPESLTHLITVSCTGFYAPGFDFALIKQLGLNAGVARTHVGFMGCHGALNALAGCTRLRRRRSGSAACSSVPSKCAVYITSMVGTLKKSLPMRSSPTGPARSSSSGAGRLLTTVIKLLPRARL